MKKILLVLAIVITAGAVSAQQGKFNGLDMTLGNLSRLSDAKTRSISPENFTGEKAKAPWPTRLKIKANAMWPMPPTKQETSVKDGK
ncbi:hypothetical protein LWM68_44865 [Niabella sp. W65]|nr:hypothetical protein [Niabella sp. W65]MCH7369240.1 hypothetical protein [Niabella sp. W65]